MSANVSCPHCSELILATPETAGRNVGCPHCSGRVIMPGVLGAKPAVVVQTSESPTANALDFLNSETQIKRSPPPTHPPAASLEFLEASTPSAAKPTPPKVAKSTGQAVKSGVGKTKEQEDALKVVGAVVVLLVLLWWTNGFGILGHGTMSRVQFEQAVMEKTQNQVIAAVGKPNFTMGDDDWVYEKRTTNPIVGGTDNFTHAHFGYGVSPDGRGICTNVTY